ncbi:FAD/NAD-P-binding domain-containing protein [Amylostereum chailletii]|nr:FAD/NAD-P-binding domain-containing protein [Amylostereum chailletii]
MRNMKTSTKASLKIDFIVAGGGLAGLSTAHSLAMAGHSVRVFERISEGERWTGGIRVPPNLTKILFQWGVEEELQKTCCTVLRTCLGDLDSGETIGYLPWAEEVQAESGAPFYTMQYCELLDILRRLALSEGVEIVHGAVVAFASPALSNPDSRAEPRTDASRPSITLTDGRTLYADVIIGADGPLSAVRRCVEEEPTIPHWDGCIYFSGVIPMKDLESEEDLNNQDIMSGYIWCGAHNAANGFPVSNATEYAVNLWYRSSIPNAEEGWLATLSPNHFKHQFSHVEKRLVKIMGKLTTVSWTRQLEWPTIEDWVDESGRIVLVGDAARPSSPGSMHGAAATVESGVVLGTLFSHLRSYDEIPTLLYAYQELSQPRMQVLETLENTNVAICFMPPGPERDARNKLLKQSLASLRYTPSEMDDLVAQWWTNYHVWTYNAFDEANDWWAGWSALKAHSLQGEGEMKGEDLRWKGIQFEAMDITVERSG